MSLLDEYYESVMDHVYDREFCVANMLPIVGLSDNESEPITTEDIINMISTTNNEYSTESFDDVFKITDNLYYELFSESSVKTPIEMSKIVDKLDSKGYKVKYASPGHLNTRFKNDRNKDLIINGKLTSTARVIFKNIEKKIEPPYLWEFKVLDGCTGLYVKPYSYSEEYQGSPEEAFKKWQEEYMNSLDQWASKRNNINGKNQDKQRNNSLNSLKLKWKK